MSDTDDQRVDGGSRKRIDQIDTSIKEWQDAEHQRISKVLIRMRVIVLVFVLASIVYYALLQGQRYDSLVAGCERTNQNAEATVRLLRSLDVREGVVRVAQVEYPHVPPLAHREGDRVSAGPPPGYSGPTTCDEYADEQVSWFRL